MPLRHCRYSRCKNSWRLRNKSIKLIELKIHHLNSSSSMNYPGAALHVDQLDDVSKLHFKSGQTLNKNILIMFFPV